MAIVLNTIYAAKDKAFKYAGADILHLVATIPIASGDSIGSIYRAFQVPSAYVPIAGTLNCDAVTSVTDADLGLYLTAEDGGAVKDVDLFLDGQSLAVEKETGSGINALTGLGMSNLGKTNYTLLSDKANEYAMYDVALTLNATATGAGVVYLRMSFAYGA